MSAPSAVLKPDSKDSQPHFSPRFLEGDIQLTGEAQDYPNGRFGWKSLLLVVIGLLCLALAVILMVNMLDHPGGALAGVVRSLTPHGGTHG
jgi:hypothetical protein